MSSFITLRLGQCFFACVRRVISVSSVYVRCMMEVRWSTEGVRYRTAVVEWWDDLDCALKEYVISKPRETSEAAPKAKKMAALSYSQYVNQDVNQDVGAEINGIILSRLSYIIYRDWCSLELGYDPLVQSNSDTGPRFRALITINFRTQLHGLCVSIIDLLNY